MPTETEHKYLVNSSAWKKVKPQKSIHIKQAYLLTDPAKTIRVRTADDKAYITIKGISQNNSRAEYEYEIPLHEAEELIKNFCNALIEKTRHLINYGGNLWEVDEFLGSNAGLIIAEIELQSDTQEYAIPVWVTKNVSNDQRYANSNLSLQPFSTW